MELTDPARDLPGLRMARPGSLDTLGLRTVADLIHYLPRRHEDRSNLRPIGGILDNETVVIRGAVDAVRSARLRGNKSYVQVALCDDSGCIDLRWWNQPWLKRTLVVGTELVAFGKVKKGIITGAEYEIVRDDDDVLHSGRIVPIYPLTKGLSNPGLRRAIHGALEGALDQLRDPLPGALLERRGLPPCAETLGQVHFPDDRETLERAKRRLRYEELFFFELAVAVQRSHVRRTPGTAHRFSPKVDERIRARLPFTMTAAQDRATAEIVADLVAPEPMNRLLQGDVGSGKTAVALYAALVVVANRGQVAFLAPTELLARQHLRTLTGLLAGSEVRIDLLVGSSTAADRRRVLPALAAGEIDILVGTHALLEPGVEFDRLGLVVVDEQHKFGVAQRASLIRKGIRPDVLVMTATPIPRTLAMTAFGDLDVSIINELPPGRHPAVTKVCTRRGSGRAYERVRSEVEAGRQAYVVYPLIEESEEIDARSAEEGFAELAAGPLRGLRLALVTGRTPSGERERIMAGFRSGELQVLVDTTVLEVGVDVPRASVMVVESAQRFGLSTLHQLRGRVGRGGTKAWCFLVADKLGGDARERLKVMEETTDGFRIAEEDLRLRGPGEFAGTRQSGLPEFRIADLSRDLDVLTEAREDAFGLLAADPGLTGEPELRAELRRRFSGRVQLYEVG